MAKKPSNWVAMVRRSLIHDYVHKGVLPNSDDAWCWSMWSGYLKSEDGALVQRWFDDAGSRAAHIHTSGHASPSDLKAFAHAMNGKQFVPIHSEAWDGDTTGFPSIRRLADGEQMAV
ncbi:MAG: MBL fold metallo-hydrolase RNA specificity domain-containing protein [Bryobacteraceae bacterium]